MKTKLLIALGIAVILALGIIVISSAVSGAGFTTFNAAADGSGKDVCKNSAINCNIYGDKTYVWINGGPSANGLGPDGQYFFAVLVPGGQPNPNDGAVGVLNDGDKNLSDDYDPYTNRKFTVTNGEVSAYTGSHDLDSGTAGNPKVDRKPPYIRLYPYADTTNPGGVYIMAICYIGQNGSKYPVNPRDCKYDAFKVKEGPATVSLYLWGMKFEDAYADGVKDLSDPGLPDWTIHVYGTGFLGEPIDAYIQTGAGGFWSYQKDYTYTKSTTLVAAELTVCETLLPGWHQSYPNPACYTLHVEPASLAEVPNLDFGNWQPVSVTACKERDLDGVLGDMTVPVPGWMVSLTKENVVVDTQPTGQDGCYTWKDLTPGYSYDLHEEMQTGWKALGPTDVVLLKAKSNDSFSNTFVNAVLQGCTPGFWQGGNDFGTAGGKWLWNEVNDPQWVASGGMGTNPYIWETPFYPFFQPSSPLDAFQMMQLVGNGGGPDDAQKAGRDMVAAYLNASWGMNYPYTLAELKAMWANAVSSGDFMSLHLTLDAANNSGADTDGDGILEHQCPISASGY